jgi:hypothetical protein
MKITMPTTELECGIHSDAQRPKTIARRQDAPAKKNDTLAHE